MADPVLEGKVVLITGASRGIGAAMATAAGKAGAQVAIVARGTGHRVADLPEHAPPPLVIDADISLAAEARGAVERTVEHFGRLDVLVNNAAVHRVAPIGEVAEGDFDLIMNTNLKGAYFACQAAAAHMSPRRSGVIINVGSNLSFVGDVDSSVYSASKGALRLLTLSLAIELGRHGIRVLSLCPGPTNTDMAKPALEGGEARRTRLLSKSVFRSIGEPEDVARTMVFLASDAARMITGTSVNVDGGALAGYLA